MAITHVIRGDDHLNNAFRQSQIYQALDWPIPEFAHVPLIHGPDGTKMSKRHGAVGVDAYRDLGYLPEAVRNYLLRLGWSHGDDEIISNEQAIAWFDLDSVGRSPARFDFAKLENLNGHYIRSAQNNRLVTLTAERLEQSLGHPVSKAGRARLREAMPQLKLRPKTLVELAANARFLVAPRPIPMDQWAAALLSGDNLFGEYRDLLVEVRHRLEALEEAAWDPAALSKTRLSNTLRDFAKQRNKNFGELAQALRAALTGSLASPGIFEVMCFLGRDETLGRIADAVNLTATP
jgi:glutamyl-tRNA synthetase